MTDIAVARRAGLAQSRYASYVNGVREPDFVTFTKICRVLGTTPNLVLGFEHPTGEASWEAVRVRAVAALGALDAAAQRLALAALEGIAEAALPEARAQPQVRKSRSSGASYPPKASRRRSA